MSLGRSATFRLGFYRFLGDVPLNLLAKGFEGFGSVRFNQLLHRRRSRSAASGVCLDFSHLFVFGDNYHLGARLRSDRLGDHLNELHRRNLPSTRIFWGNAAQTCHHCQAPGTGAVSTPGCPARSLAHELRSTKHSAGHDRPLPANSQKLITNRQHTWSQPSSSSSP